MCFQNSSWKLSIITRQGSLLDTHKLFAYTRKVNVNCFEIYLFSYSNKHMRRILSILCCYFRRLSNRSEHSLVLVVVAILPKQLKSWLIICRHSLSILRKRIWNTKTAMFDHFVWRVPYCIDKLFKVFILGFAKMNQIYSKRNHLIPVKKYTHYNSKGYCEPESFHGLILIIKISNL